MEEKYDMEITQERAGRIRDVLVRLWGDQNEVKGVSAEIRPDGGDSGGRDSNERWQ